MTDMDIPGFEIVGPRDFGLLQQFTIVGWKWDSPMGLLGEWVQVSTLPDVATITDRFLRFGRTWHRRMVVAPDHHLWIAAFLLKGKTDFLARQVERERAETETYCVDTRRFGSWFHTLLLRLFFGYTRPAPRYDWDEDDD